VPRQQPRTERVADDYGDERQSGEEARPVHVEADQGSHPGGPEHEPADSGAVEAVGAGGKCQQCAHHRHGGDEKSSQRARQPPLGAEQRQPRDADLDDGVDEHGAPPPDDRGELPPDGDQRQKQHRPAGGADEDEEGGGDLTHRDADEQIRQAPHHAEQDEEDPSAPAHRSILAEPGFPPAGPLDARAPGA
jgi:hypothetical protein